MSDFISKRIYQITNRKLSIPHAVIIGDKNDIFGSHVHVTGNGNKITGPKSTTIGNGNTIFGSKAHITGDDNTYTGYKAKIFGNRNRIFANDCEVNGIDNVVIGKNNTVNGVFYEELKDPAQISTIVVPESTDRDRVAPVEVKLVKTKVEGVKSDEEDEEVKVCVVCLTNLPNCAALPCGHLIFCCDCSIALVYGQDHKTKRVRTAFHMCPKCRVDVTEFKYMFT